MPKYRIIPDGSPAAQRVESVFLHCQSWDVFVLGIPFDPVLQEYVIETQQAIAPDDMAHVGIEEV